MGYIFLESIRFALGIQHFESASACQTVMRYVVYRVYLITGMYPMVNPAANLFEKCAAVYVDRQSAQTFIEAFTNGKMDTSLELKQPCFHTEQVIAH